MEQSSPRDFVSKKLITRIRIFGVISIAIVLFIVRDVWVGDISWWLAALALLVGALVGTGLGRLMTIKWHETDEQAVSELDVIGVIAIAAYIALDLSRDWIFGHFLAGATLSAFTLAILGGALFGRAFGIRLSILSLLRKRKLIPEA